MVETPERYSASDRSSIMVDAVIAMSDAMSENDKRRETMVLARKESMVMGRRSSLWGKHGPYEISEEM